MYIVHTLYISLQDNVIKNLHHSYTTEYFISFYSRLCIKDVRSLCVNIDRALIFLYDLHKHFMQLILKFGQYLQHSLFIT